MYLLVAKKMHGSGYGKSELEVFAPIFEHKGAFLNWTEVRKKKQKKRLFS